MHFINPCLSILHLNRYHIHACRPCRAVDAGGCTIDLAGRYQATLYIIYMVALQCYSGLDAERATLPADGCLRDRGDLLIGSWIFYNIEGMCVGLAINLAQTPE